MRKESALGIQIPVTYLPKPGIDLSRWAVIACDQYTSQPEYWKSVADLVGSAPSTYHLILPEVYLNSPEESSRVRSTQEAMRTYLADGILEPHEELIYVERSVDGRTRRGIMLALDLEAYDFTPVSQSLIRATEGTILDRLPPRMRIREGAPLELPHILVLIDDPQDRVIGSIEAAKETLPLAYDFDLMQGSGHLTARFVDNQALEDKVIDSLKELASRQVFYPKYNVSTEKGVLLFAVGDGNHSLATAKSIWEKIKPQVGMDHPARYALVEIENIHDRGLEFAPIHRVLFNVQSDPLEALRTAFAGRLTLALEATPADMQAAVTAYSGADHIFGVITPQGSYTATLQAPTANLPVGSLQPVLDSWMKAGYAASIDYVHGDDIVVELGSQAGNVGFFLPAMAKGELFRTVMLDGVLPRKTFSMGEAQEKRFYMEARKITE